MISSYYTQKGEIRLNLNSVLNFAIKIKIFFYNFNNFLIVEIFIFKKIIVQIIQIVIDLKLIKRKILLKK